MPNFNESLVYLYPVDDGVNDNLPIVSQFPPVDPTESMGALNIAKISIPGTQYPRLQFVNGEHDTFSFGWMVSSDPSVDNYEIGTRPGRTVYDYRTKLRDARRIVPSLGRPPLWRFVWGDIEYEEVMIESIGQIVYRDELNDLGSQVFAQFEVTLLVFSQFDELEFADEDSTTPDPALVDVVEGLTYEQVALQEYGDASLGVALRNNATELDAQGLKDGPSADWDVVRNLEINNSTELGNGVDFTGSGQDVLKQAFPKAGSKISIVDKIVAKKLGVSPRSIALQLKRGDVNAAVNSAFNARTRATAPGRILGPNPNPPGVAGFVING